jgi:FixJ family two-component response regulator
VPIDLQQLIADIPDVKIREIMELTIKGKNNIQIAKTIKIHIRTVYRKIAFCRNVLTKYKKNTKLTQLEEKILEVYKYCKGDKL